jgi:hypothetical protein
MRRRFKSLDARLRKADSSEISGVIDEAVDSFEEFRGDYYDSSSVGKAWLLMTNLTDLDSIEEYLDSADYKKAGDLRGRISYFKIEINTDRLGLSYVCALPAVPVAPLFRFAWRYGSRWF